MSDGGACQRCGYAMVLRPGDIWRCSSCRVGVDGSIPSSKTESPGQRIARELEEALNAGKGYDLIDAINVAIDARTELLEAEARHAALVLVRRERAGVLREAADAFADQSSNFVRVNEGRRLTPAQYHCAGIWRDASNRLRARAAQEEKDDG